MKKPMCTKEDSFNVEEELFVSDKTDHIAKILNANHQLSNLKELTANLPHLGANQHQQSFNCLNKRATLFNAASVQANLQTRS